MEQPVHIDVSPLRDAAAHELLSIQAGASLFKAGEPRDRIFKICKGAVALAQPRNEGLSSIVRIATPGDFIGVGWLEEHTETARAISPCTVEILTPDEFRALAADDEALREQLSDAVERDFEARKVQLTDRRATTALECVASFLVAISRQNVYEGRDPLVISDSLTCGVVGELLKMNLDVLAQSLLQLKKIGIIADGPGDEIVIRDLGTLIMIADAEPDRTIGDSALS